MVGRSNTIMGGRSDYDKIVKLACKPKNAPPKAKYLDALIAGTFDQNSTDQIARALAQRLREPNGIVSTPLRACREDCFPQGSRRKQAEPVGPVGPVDDCGREDAALQLWTRRARRCGGRVRDGPTRCLAANGPPKPPMGPLQAETGRDCGRDCGPNGRGLSDPSCSRCCQLVLQRCWVDDVIG